MIEDYLKIWDNPELFKEKGAGICHCKKITGNEIPDGLDIIWLKGTVTCKEPQDRGFAFLWHDGKNIHACAILEDRDVKTDARGRNDRTWAKGDVMELFFMPPEKINYFELHLAPSLSTLELAIPSVDTWRGLELEEMFFDSGVKCKSEKFETSSGIKGWWGHMKVPLARLGADSENLSGARVAVCRYNYNTEWGQEPELSATTAFKERNFHQPHLWHILK